MRKRMSPFRKICFWVGFLLLFITIGWSAWNDYYTGQMPSAVRKDSVDADTAAIADDSGEGEVDADTEETETIDTKEIETADAEETEATDAEDASITDVETTDTSVVNEEIVSGNADLAVCTGKVTRIAEDGSLVTDISTSKLAKNGIGQDDLVDVSVGGRNYILPLEMDDPFPELWGRTKLTCDTADSRMMITRSYQDFSKMEGFTDEIVGETAQIRLLQSDAYQMRKMVKPETVSPSTAANFRSIQTGGLGEGVLYRGHSPISPEYESFRCNTSDHFAWENRINSIINLNQDDDEVEEEVYKDCPESYYRYLYDWGGVSAIELDGKHAFDAAFGEGIAEHMRFMLRHDGPYLIHCRMGRDRAGFVSALLEALEGSTYEEIGEDYALSFRNYYGIIEGSWMDRYNAADGANTFFKMMEPGDTDRFDGDDGTLTRKAAEAYLKDIGLTEAEISTLQKKLAEDLPMVSADR